MEESIALIQKIMYDNWLVVMYVVDDNDSFMKAKLQHS